MADVYTARERFDRFLGQLLATAAADPDIIGIVGMGSTGARHRVDEWSDHDVAVVTTAATCERFRCDLTTWLPDGANIAMSAREIHDGIVVVLDDGHVVELGVTSLDDLTQWHADPDSVDVLYDAGGVAEVIAQLARKGLPAGVPDDARDIRVGLARLLIGVGRARRGEVLSAGQLIRGEAAGLLLAVIARRVPAAGRPAPDPFDPRRRFLPKPRAALGPPAPICWPIFDDEHERQMIDELTDWVEWARWRFNLDHRTIPDCWMQHGPLIEELSALYTAWQTAYTDLDGSAPLLWMSHFDSARDRLTEWVARTGCRPGEHRAGSAAAR